MRVSARSPVSITVGAFALTGAIWLTAGRIQELPEVDEDETATRPPAETLRVTSPGYEALLSDWYWLLAIQYYGTPSKVLHQHPLLPGLLDAAVELDPEFDYVYQFGGEVLPEQDPATKLWHHTEAAKRLLEKGMRTHSVRWQIPFVFAYVLYTFDGDYLAAGKYMKAAAERPKAPLYLSGFAAKLLAQGGEVETAIAFAEAALSSATDDRTRQDLEERILALRLQEDLEQLNAALKKARESGVSVRSLGDLVGHGVAEIPRDPFGGEFSLSGDQIVSPHQDRLLHLFIHPGAPPTERHVD